MTAHPEFVRGMTVAANIIEEYRTGGRMISPESEADLIALRDGFSMGALYAGLEPGTWPKKEDDSGEA